MFFATGPADDLDLATVTPKFGSKMGIDATEKMIEEGRTKEWPPEITMSPHVKAQVDARWSEYGFDGPLDSRR